MRKNNTANNTLKMSDKNIIKMSNKNPMLSAKNIFLNSSIIMFMSLIIISYAAADCGSLTPSNHATGSNIFGFYGGISNEWGSPPGMNPIAGYLFKDSSQFTSSDMSSIFRSYIPSAGYGGGAVPITGGVDYNYDCDMAYTAGIFVYGRLDSINLNLATSGTEGWTIWDGWQYRPIGYAAVQAYRLYDAYDSAPYNRMISNPSSVSVYDLTSDPVGGVAHLKGRGSVTGGTSIFNGYGIYYIALAGGHDSQNGDWHDDYKLGVTIGGDYITSIGGILTPAQLRAKLSPTMFESQAGMCALVGQHITTQGFAGQTGVIKCCGARGDSDLNTFNLQYECLKDGSGNYYWQSVCNKNGTLNPTETGKKTTYCTECSNASTGRCTGDLALSCTGTYYCTGTVESTCDAKPGCYFKYNTQEVCPPGARVSGSDVVSGNNIDNIHAGAQFGAQVKDNAFSARIRENSFMPIGECYIITLDTGNCKDINPATTSYSCSGVSLSTCNAIGCRITDSAGATHYLGDTCADMTYAGQDSCRARTGCSWECRGDPGDACSVNSDCQSPLQCDADFLNKKTCHPTDNKCVVGPYGNYTSTSEVSANAYVCANKIYKQCAVGATAYTTDYCSATSGFTCTGTPNPQACSGTLNCGLSSPTTCTPLDCTIGGNCMNPNFDPVWVCDGLPQVKGMDYDGSYKGSNNHEDFAASKESGFIVENCVIGHSGGHWSTDPCIGKAKTSCTGSCTWNPYCTPSKSCSSYTVANCASGHPGCSVAPSFTSCSGLSYGNCAQGCSKRCVLPYFGNAISYSNAYGVAAANDTATRGACACAGGNIVSCYADKDGDRYPSGAAVDSVLSCRIGNNNQIKVSAYGVTTTYYCAYTGLYDCNDLNKSINPDMLELNNSIDDNCNGQIDEGFCNNGNSCSSTSVCVEGMCVSNCTASFKDNSPIRGQRCSPFGSAVSYLGYGICTQNILGVSSCDPTGAAFYQDDDLIVHYSSCFAGMDGLDCTVGSLAGGFVSNGICASGVCVSYILYSNRTGFDESPKFLVPSSGPITKVCDPLNTTFCVSVDATPTPKNYSVPNITIGIPYIVCSDPASMLAFCKGKNSAYDSATTIGAPQTMSNNCAYEVGTVWNTRPATSYYGIKCYKYDTPTNRGEASNLKILLNNSGSGSYGVLTYKCGGLDGVCPDTFSNTQICANTGTDPDCGVHAYMKCLNVYDTSNHLEGNTCNYTKIPDSTNPQCGIMSAITNITRLHAQCTNGAVVQGLNGCPMCLHPSETITYGDGVSKYIGFTKVTENRTLAYINITGYDAACPSKKYYLKNISGAMSCTPVPAICDYGYRTIISGAVKDNYLVKKCDQPSWFNSTTNRWQFNMACVYNSTIVPGKLGTYCGLQSWYMGYEIYDDKFNIVVI